MSVNALLLKTSQHTVVFCVGLSCQMSLSLFAGKKPKFLGFVRQICVGLSLALKTYQIISTKVTKVSCVCLKIFTCTDLHVFVVVIRPYRLHVITLGVINKLLLQKGVPTVNVIKK